MANKEDVTILRRFDELNILNLLVLQDEIQGLSETLKGFFLPKKDDSDGVPPGYLASYTNNYKPETANEPQQPEEEAMTSRADKWKLLRIKLKEYSVLHPSFRKCNFLTIAHGKDSSILELAQLRNLDPPIPADITRLRKELKDLAALSKFTSSSEECWHSNYEDDFVVIRSDSHKSKRLNIWVRFIMGLIKWELWAWKKVGVGSLLPFRLNTMGLVTKRNLTNRQTPFEVILEILLLGKGDT